MEDLGEALRLIQELQGVNLLDTEAARREFHGSRMQGHDTLSGSGVC